jgi:PhnB protein
MSFNPYLFFSGGQCRAAFTTYQQIFGGDLQVMTAGDIPPGEEAMPGADPDMVLHAALTIGDSMLMGSDDPTGDDGPKLGFSVTHSAADADSAHRVFDALADGGEVTQPLIPTFFSAAFGLLTDRFGVPWMIVAEAAPEG